MQRTVSRRRAGFPVSAVVRRVAVVTAACLAAALCPPVYAAAADGVRIEDPIVIRSFDGTPIVATLMLPAGASGDRPVPAILETHGWGGSRLRAPGAWEQPLLDRGYAVLTWDSRGWGDSGGEASPAGPAEVGDAGAMIDYLASRPEIELDRPGDPKVGWLGASNAAGVQYNTAATDRRVDAIAPIAGWGDLNRDLWPNGTVKTAWWEGVYAAGLVTAMSDGWDSPAGAQFGVFDQHIHSTHTELLLTGQMSAENKAWWAARSTTTHSGAITAPTLIVQGSIDTFFPLEDGFANYRNLVAAGTPVKLVTVCAGHTFVGCKYGPTQSDTDAVTGKVVWYERLLDWMDRWVKGDRSVKTGPAFEWQANNGSYYAADSYPLPKTASLTGRAVATGTLIGPGGTGGDGPANGAPAPAVELGATATRAEVVSPGSAPRAFVGVPTVRLTGSATGLTAQVHLELVDRAPDGSRVTVDDQTMPWVFAGRIDQDVALHGITWRLEPGHALELEITTGSAQYAPPPTGAYTVELTAVPTLPVTPVS